MRKDLALSLLAVAISIPARAQTDAASESSQAEHIVVTATRNPLPGRELGASVIVLQREDFENSGAQTVSDILRGLPGISMRRNGGAGSNTEILIRGDKGGHTMIMLDGVELADVTTIEKNSDIGDLPLHDVERIEIVKGPHSVAYGGSGLSGVIHIITRRPEAGVGGSAGLEAGSYDTYGAHARVAGQAGELGYTAVVSGTRTGGFSHAGSRDDGERDAFERKDASLRLQYEGGGFYSADFLVKGFQSVADFDAGANEDDPNSQVKRQDVLSQITQKLRLGDQYETRLAAGIAQSDRRYFDDPDLFNPNRDQTWDRSRFEGERRTVDFSQLIHLAPAHTLVASAQWLHDSAEVQNQASYQGFNVDEKLPKETLKELSYALQYQWGLWDRLHGQWGVRTLKNEVFGETTVGQAAFNWILVPEWTTLRLNYGRGFKTPSLYQLRVPIYGNAELQPEAVVSLDGGIEQNLGSGLTASVTGFQSDTSNLIDFDSASSRYYNISRSLIKGIETTVDWDITSNLSTAAQFTHISTLDRESNKPLPSRPDETWSGNVTWKENGFSWMTAIRGQTRSRARPYVDGTEGFRVVDTALTLSQGPARYSLKVNNVLNSWYQEVAGYNTAARNVLGSAAYSF
ncbi:MAG TPA: TonB-dependent receptor [Oligoflexus sp.]|uniref:TonB-dependent receptor plug domain-containing protein n=1 Tax=Oligoflexus sp. TaxID=1971216 RepID=UPI002D7FE4A7|nr:TonB-dependent receptor [Oligoflexus sp.]HET9239707.1 TonB-dependent receptor [Oligoflexus sp.]